MCGLCSGYRCGRQVTVDCLLFEADKLSGLAHFVQCAARHFLLQCMQTTYNRKLYHEVSIPFVTPQVSLDDWVCPAPCGSVVCVCVLPAVVDGGVLC